jgi:hypothetical protein
MYQFTTTNIINSNLDSNGVTPKYVGTSAAFKVARVGTFYAHGPMMGGIIGAYKRPYSAGVLEVAEVVVPTVAAGLVIKIEVEVGLHDQTLAEYASTHLDFRKPVVLEIISSGTAATDAAKLVLELNKLKDRFDKIYFKSAVDGTTPEKIVFTAIDDNQTFNSVKLFKQDPSIVINSMYEPALIEITDGTFAVTTEGKTAFGDTQWMHSHITMQTLENNDPFGISMDERPVIGGKYTQFTIEYLADKDHADGITKGLDVSKTTHVFYVLDALVSDFENELDNTVTIVTI